MTEILTGTQIRELLPRVGLKGVAVPDDQIAEAVHESLVPGEVD